MHASRFLDRSAAAQSPSLRTFLAELPEEDILRISDPTELDYLPTALILELEKRRRTPVVMIERPKGFVSTVVMNLFASRDRLRGWLAPSLTASMTPGCTHLPI